MKMLKGNIEAIIRNLYELLTLITHLKYVKLGRGTTHLDKTTRWKKLIMLKNSCTFDKYSGTCLIPIFVNNVPS